MAQHVLRRLPPASTEVLLAAFVWLTFSLASAAGQGRSETTPGQSRAEAVPVRAADAVCGKCHRGILKSYLRTPMANASGLAGEHLLPGAYLDASSGVQYTVSMEADGPRLHFETGASTGNAAAADGPSGSNTVGGGSITIQGTEQLRYFLGSGHIGLTYLYEKNGYLLESPVAFYERLQGYRMAPGVEGRHEMPPALMLNPSCLRCHMSGVQKQVAGTDNLYPGLPFEQLGITCESCHGDSREHVATAGKAAMVNPLTLAPERRDSTCIVCHLEGDTSVERRNRAVLGFTPGDDIRDSITYFVAAGENTTKRAVSEVEQFSSSHCKVVSGSKMSCMNCHNPHVSPPPLKRVAFYRAKCLACHNGPFFTTQHFPANPDCTSCHMPKVGSENIAHVAWTDHRIRRRPNMTELVTSASEQKSDGQTDLVSVLPGAATARDFGLAYYNLAVHGMRSARQRATKLLDAAAKADAVDAPVLQALGILAEMNGDSARAASYYRAALRIEPDNYVSGTNLGTLLAASGNLEEAAAFWREVFQHNQDIPELGQNLALTECLLGDREQARQVLTEVLTYSPGLLRARSMLAAIEKGELSCVIQPH